MKTNNGCDIVKKILLLTYFFPPSNLAGSHRMQAWANYLHTMGYYPVVVTRRWDDLQGLSTDLSKKTGREVLHEKDDKYEVYRLPYSPNLRDRIFTKYGDNKFRAARRILSFFEVVFQNYYLKVVPYGNLYKQASQVLTRDRSIQLIIASGGPFVLFRFAGLLHKKFNIPWIADYRDEWSTNLISKTNFLPGRFVQKLERRSERKWTRSATCFISVSQAVTGRIAAFIGKPGYVVLNGYEEQYYPNNENRDFFKDFTITYNGTLYPIQRIEVFLSAAKTIIDEYKDRIHINLLFPGLGVDARMAEKVSALMKGYEENTRISGRIPQVEIVDMMLKSHVLLSVAYEGTTGFYSTKIFEYLACKRPIILCPTGRDVMESLITQAGAGYICNTHEEAAERLRLLINEYLTTGNVACNSDVAFIRQFTREAQTRVLAQLLDQHFTDDPSRRTPPRVSAPRPPLDASSSTSPSSTANFWLSRPYQQCTRCVMDTSDPEIRFDENGYCNHCTDYFQSIQQRTYQGAASDEKLQQLIAGIKRAGRGRKYDVVVGISGGVDSIYTALKAREYGLRVLAVHLDNGWNSELAVKNIEKILEKLQIDLHTEVLDWGEFRDLQLAFLKASVPEAETPTDIAIPAVLHKYAARYRVKYIFSGGNFATEGILPKSWHYDAKDLTYLKGIHQRFGTHPLKTFPTFGFLRETRYKLLHGIRMVYPLNLLPYNKKEAIRLLEEQLEWRNYGGKHHESLYTKWVQSYLLPQKFGIDYRKATFSTQICAGELSRDEALRELQQPVFSSATLRDDNEYVAKKLGITPAELDDIVALPAKSFRDYPNAKRWLEFVYRTYRRVKGK